MKERVCIIGQSGGPTVAINATLAGVIKAAKENGYTKVYGMIHGIEGFLENTITELDVLYEENRLEQLINTPAMYLGSCRFKLDTEDNHTKQAIIDMLISLHITDMFYIGGNDSMDTVYQLSMYATKNKYQINFIGIPKTIDNDLEGTYYTPGYPSACQYVGTTMLEISYDSKIYPEPSVTIVEIMGRDAGWLTASTALLNAKEKLVDLIYLPEVVFNIDTFVQEVKKVMSTKHHVLIAVSEGIKDETGSYLAISKGGKLDAFGHYSRSGCAQYLKQYLSSKIDSKIKTIELNIMQRCSGHLSNKMDLENSICFGEAAVHFALKNATGIMVGAKVEDNKIKFIDSKINLVANKVKPFPKEWIDEKNCQIRKAYLDYMIPIMGQKGNIGFPKYLRREVG